MLGMLTAEHYEVRSVPLPLYYDENIFDRWIHLAKHKLPGVCRDKSLLMMLHRCVFPSQCVSVILRLNMRCWTMYESMLACE